MSSTRLETLKGMAEANPSDSFVRYGLAMEYSKLGDTNRALEEFRSLLTSHPDYTAGYFMAAQTLAKHGRTAEAISRLKAGISCAARTDNRHALSEMQSMLDELDR